MNFLQLCALDIHSQSDHFSTDQYKESSIEAKDQEFQAATEATENRIQEDQVEGKLVQ